MKRILRVKLATLVMLVFFAFAANAADVTPVIVIHGGTSGMNLTQENFQKRVPGMEKALKAGQAVLIAGGTAEDAVIAAIVVLEDDPEFNSGKGAVFNAAGENELDASLMDGETRKAGAVAGARRIKNPIKAARVVKDATWHTLIAGDGADKLAEANGLEMVDPKYFHTEARYQQLLKAKEKAGDKTFIDHEKIDKPKKQSMLRPEEPYLGTVGAIALDKKGNLAAGTSTGGMTNKMAGRIGDSPIIGSGTYADNEGLAISCTGSGDIFMRVNAAHEANALYKYKNMTPEQAAQGSIDQVKALDGRGGIIALDAKGVVGFGWTKQDLGVYRGVARGDAAPEIFFPVAK